MFRRQVVQICKENTSDKKNIYESPNDIDTSLKHNSI